MTQSVFKYPFQIENSFDLKLPKGAKILSAQIQDHVPCLWALVNIAGPREVRKFRLYGTGHPISENNLEHVATFQMPPFVWHLFEEK